MFLKVVKQILCQNLNIRFPADIRSMLPFAAEDIEHKTRQYGIRKAYRPTISVLNTMQRPSLIYPHITHICCESVLQNVVSSDSCITLKLNMSSYEVILDFTMYVILSGSFVIIFIALCYLKQFKYRTYSSGQNF